MLTQVTHGHQPFANRNQDRQGLPCLPPSKAATTKRKQLKQVKKPCVSVKPEVEVIALGSTSPNPPTIHMQSAAQVHKTVILMSDEDDDELLVIPHQPKPRAG